MKEEKTYRKKIHTQYIAYDVIIYLEKKI